MIVDTTVWVDYLRGTDTPGVAWLSLEMDRQRLGLTDINLCEILQGVPDDREASRLHQDIVRRFQVFHAGGEAIAGEAARSYRALRKKGLTVRKTIDCLIAAFCISRGYALLHNDRDFDPFERELGLRVVHP